MRIGLFSDTYLPVINGVVTSIVTLRNGLIKRGHDVFVVSNHDKIFELDYKDKVLYLPGINIKYLFNNNLSNPVQMRALEIIKQMNLDLIHVHTEFGIGLFARTVSKKENIPLVYTYHTTWEDYTHYVNPLHLKPVEKVAKKMVATLSRQLSKPADAIITPSSKTKELLLKYGVYQPIHVIPTGVNLDRFKETDEIIRQAQQIREKYNIKKDELLLIFVGRLGEEKNIDLVIEAVKMNPIKLMLVGHGPIYDRLVDMVKQEQLEDKIILTNKVPNDQIAGYYHAADAFISASLSETQGLTFIEAMACGNPLLASDKEILSDLLIDQENGYFFDTLDDLNKVLDTFIHLNPLQRQQLSKRSLELVRPYSDEVFVDSIEDLYAKVLTQNESLVFVVKLVQKGNESALVELESELSRKTFILSLNDIEKYQIMEDRIISLKEISELKEKDLINKRVSKCLSKLTYHDYSEAQMRQYLQELDPDHPILNEEVIKVLTKKGFINDERFIFELLERYKEKGYGRFRILENFKKYEFDDQLVEMVLVQLDETEKSDLQKQFEQCLLLNFKGSKKAVLNKVYGKLVRQGFNASAVSELIQSHEFEYDELPSCQVDYQKLLKTQEDMYVIKSKLQAKGYSLTSITQVVKEK